LTILLGSGRGGQGRQEKGGEGGSGETDGGPHDQNRWLNSR